MARVISAKLVGGESDKLGIIPAADIAKLIFGLQRVLAAAANSVARRQRRRGPSGRYPQVIEAASRLTFVGVDHGSVDSLFALAQRDLDDEQQLDISVPDLAELSFDRLTEALQAPLDSVDRDIARTVARLAQELGIGRTERTLLLGSRGDRRPRSVIDAAMRERMGRIAAMPEPERDDLLTGRLAEADFDANTARLQQATGGPVTVEFEDDQADAIHRALRGPAQLTGIVTYDRETLRARRIDLHDIETPAQLTLISGDRGPDFWEHRSIDDLAIQQGIYEPQNPASIRAQIPPTTEEIEAFFSEINE